MSANVMELIVVPALSLNPRKVRRNIKKAAEKSSTTVMRLPADSHVADPVLLEVLPVQSHQAPMNTVTPYRPQRAASRTKSWFELTEEDDQQAPIKAVAPCQSQSLVLGKQSWFRLTEEDNDDFFGVGAIGIQACSAVVHARPSQLAAPLAEPTSMLSGLQTDALVHVFLFTEVSAVGRAAAACTALRAHMWEDTQFWPSYAGRSLAATSAPGLRGAFRRWVHGLEGSWGTDFAAMAASRHHLDVFDDAAYLLTGLQLQDKATDDAEVKVFVEASLAELRSFDADCDETRERALEVVVRAGALESFLPAGAAEEMREAFDASVKPSRSAWGQSGRLSSATEPKPTTRAAVAWPAGQSLALTALGALNTHHQGFSTAAAQRAVVGHRA